MTMRTPSRCARGANGRLTSATWGTLAYGFTYNGLGDRLRQAVGGAPTNYSLDLVGGLTQVLSDGTNAYLYGNGRIGEDQPGGWQYHLSDALGSVRQLVDTTVGVALSRAYEPFGDPLLTTGSGSTVFGFTGEQRDGTGLVYLRARYYAPPFGRFLSRDIWQGDPRQPMSYNAWLYVYANPLNATDPSGMCPDEDLDGRCDPWWLRCDMISDPQARAQCLRCYAPTAEPPLPWRMDRDYDPETDSIPNWGIPGTSRADMPLRQDHARRVWDWICEAGGWWGSGCPQSLQLAGWLLNSEQNILLSDTYYYLNGGDSGVAGRVTSLVVRYLRVDLENFSPNPALSYQTSFFNPVHDDRYDLNDWNRLTSSGGRPPSVAEHAVRDHWNDTGPENFMINKLIWWGPGETWPPGVEPGWTMYSDEQHQYPLQFYALAGRP